MELAWLIHIGAAVTKIVIANEWREGSVREGVVLIGAWTDVPVAVHFIQGSSKGPNVLSW